MKRHTKQASIVILAVLGVLFFPEALLAHDCSGLWDCWNAAAGGAAAAAGAGAAAGAAGGAVGGNGNGAEREPPDDVPPPENADSPVDDPCLE